MMNVEDAPVNYDVSKRRVKKALPFDDNGKIKVRFNVASSKASSLLSLL